MNFPVRSRANARHGMMHTNKLLHSILRNTVQVSEGLDMVLRFEGDDGRGQNVAAR